MSRADRSATGAPTTEQIRHAIDSGRAGDKVSVVDPAAAPLGTDEEAAGTPASPQERRMTAAAEGRGFEPRGAKEINRLSGRGAVWTGLLLGLAAAVALGLALMVALG